MKGSYCSWLFGKFGMIWRDSSLAELYTFENSRQCTVICIYNMERKYDTGEREHANNQEILHSCAAREPRIWRAHPSFSWPNWCLQDWFTNSETSLGQKRFRIHWIQNSRDSRFERDKRIQGWDNEDWSSNWQQDDSNLSWRPSQIQLMCTASID